MLYNLIRLHSTKSFIIVDDDADDDDDDNKDDDGVTALEHGGRVSEDLVI